MGFLANSGPNSGEVTLSWTTPFDGGSQITAYTISWDNGGLQTAPAEATGLVISGLTPAQTYTFSITAQNGVGSSTQAIITNCDDETDNDGDNIANCHDTEAVLADCDGIDNDGDGQIDEGFFGGGKIVFTAPSSLPWTIPNASTGQGGVNTAVTISTTGGTGIFQGATGWINAFDNTDIQNFSWRTTASTPTTTVGGSRTVDLRFNQFTLSGTCALCGQVVVPSSNGYLLGGIFPATGQALNTGVTNGATVRAGTLYGSAAITFAIPGSSAEGNVSFEAISGGGYTITLEAPTNAACCVDANEDDVCD